LLVPSTVPAGVSVGNAIEGVGNSGGVGGWPSELAGAEDGAVVNAASTPSGLWAVPLAFTAMTR
jgi:hypothetical protein